MFNIIFFIPLYNALMLLGTVVPGGDMGIAIMLLTVIVRGALSPLSHKMLTTQKKLRDVEPKISEVREKHKSNPEEQGRQIMAIYKEHGINPFSGFAFFIVQIPLFIALYGVAQDNFKNAAKFAYSFVTPPAEFATQFLGFIDLTQPSWIFAVIAGVTFFIQARYSVPPPAPADPKKESSFSADFMRGMSLQTRYFLPIFIGLISLKLSVAVVLYIITSNLFSIGHEIYVKRTALAAVK